TDNTQFGTRFAAAQTILRQNHALSYTRILSPRFLNEARLAYVRANQDFPENDPTSSTVQINSFFNIGGSSAFPQGRLDHTWQFQNVSTYTTGKHSVKFGADLRKYGLFNNSAVDSKGTWTFGTLEDFINNNPSNLRQSVNTASFNVNQWNHAYFVQDDF